MYGVNWPNEDIDYAAEAAKRNVKILGDRFDELKRENAELRECLKEALEVIKSQDARIALLERALKPVMECDMGDETKFTQTQVTMAVAEAQCIMKKGEAK